MDTNGKGVGAPASVPVSAVVIGAENLDASLDYYAGTLGPEVAETRIWKGPDFERYWHLPAACARR